MQNMNPQHLRALVLNANYQPVDVFPLMHIPVQDAITRCYNSKPTCRVELEWPLEIKTQKGGWNIKWPSIIIRNSTNIFHKDRVFLNHTTLFYRDLGKCAYCSGHIPESEGTIDHVHPVSQGGKNRWDNVVWCCQTCNWKKGDKLPKGEFEPKNKPWTPDFWDLLRHRKKFPLRIQDSRWLDYLPDWEGEVVCEYELGRSL